MVTPEKNLPLERGGAIWEQTSGQKYLSRFLQRKEPWFWNMHHVVNLLLPTARFSCIFSCVVLGRCILSRTEAPKLLFVLEAHYCMEQQKISGTIWWEFVEHHFKRSHVQQRLWFSNLDLSSWSFRNKKETFIKRLLPMNDESFCFSVEHQVAKGPSSRFWVPENTHILKVFYYLERKWGRRWKQTNENLT